jgi:hypothetical protein
MRILIENLENGLFMDSVSEWGPKEEGYDFQTPGLAIELCLIRRLRNVRIIIETGELANDCFLVLYGSDLVGLNEAMRKNEELRELQKALRADLDGARAEKKELRKRFPFKRKSVAEGDEMKSDPGSA